MSEALLRASHHAAMLCRSGQLRPLLALQCTQFWRDMQTPALPTASHIGIAHALPINCPATLHTSAHSNAGLMSAAFQRFGLRSFTTSSAALQYGGRGGGYGPNYYAPIRPPVNWGIRYQSGVLQRHGLLSKHYYSTYGLI